MDTYMEATEQLVRAANDTLLRSYAALTHQMHTSQNPDLRRSRDLIEEEILRRMTR